MSDTIQEKLVVKKTLTLKEVSDILSEYVAYKYKDRLVNGQYKTSLEFTLESTNSKDEVKEVSPTVPFAVVEVTTRKN